MQTTGNTLLVTGGGSGIGLELAKAFSALGNEVIIAGRRESVLRQQVADNPGLQYKVLDVSDAEDLQRVAQACCMPRASCAANHSEQAPPNWMPPSPPTC